MDGKNILITGGLGFIGSTIAQKTVELGANVTVYDALMPQYGGNVANIEEIAKKIEVIKGDVRDFEALKEHVKNKDVIFHCAAQVSHVQSLSDPYLDIDINCRGTINLLEASRKFNDEVRIVYSGTRSQIGKMVYSPVDEAHPEFPADIYSANKSAAEKYCLIYYNTYGIRTSSLRISNVYGPRGQIKERGYGIVNYLIRMAILNEVITVYEPGTQTRDCIYADDVADAMIMASQNDKTDGEVFFVGSGKTVSFIDLVKLIIKLTGNGSWIFTPWPSQRKAIEVGDVSLSIKKISSLLDWTPNTALEDGLRKTIDFYKRNIKSYL